jgi:hypothetical protein
VENIGKGAIMVLQRNVSRKLSEKGEIPSSLFFMRGVAGLVSVANSPTVTHPFPQISFGVVNNAVWSSLALPSLAG